MGEANRRRIAEKLGLKVPHEARVWRYRQVTLYYMEYDEHEQHRLFKHPFFREWQWSSRSDFDLFVLQQGQDRVREVVSKWEEAEQRKLADELEQKQVSLLTESLVPVARH